MNHEQKEEEHKENGHEERLDHDLRRLEKDEKRLEQDIRRLEEDEHHVPGPEHHDFHIQIDRVHYTVHKKELTGEELRHVPPTPIGPDRDLFEVVPGGTDRKIGDNEKVEIRDGKRFFTAPAQINPGSF